MFDDSQTSVEGIYFTFMQLGVLVISPRVLYDTAHMLRLHEPGRLLGRASHVLSREAEQVDIGTRGGAERLGAPLLGG